MSAGPGNSVKLWKGYFKAMGVPLQLYVFEYNEKCGRKWLAKQNAETLQDFAVYFGDQANEDDLNKAVIASGGMFDAIVDDGDMCAWAHVRFADCGLTAPRGFEAASSRL